MARFKLFEDSPINPDIRIEELAPDGLRELARRIEETLREHAEILNNIQKRQTAAERIQKSVAASGQNIQVGHLLHLRDDGQTAYLANATPAGESLLYYATSVCVGVTTGGTVYSIDAGTTDILCEIPTNQDGTLWLSSTKPGWACDFEPEYGSGKLSQAVGYKRGTRGSGGLCNAKINCQGWTRR